MKKRFNDNDFTNDTAMLKKRKDADSKKYEKEVQEILEAFYGYSFKDRESEIKEYDLEAVTGEKIEVKSDYGILTSKKLFVEIWDNLAKKQEGWLRYCTADTLAVVHVDDKLLAPMKISFLDFKAMQRYILTTYYKGDWANAEKLYKDEFEDRFVFALKDRPYLKYMLIEMRNLKPFIKFEYEYPWT